MNVICPITTAIKMLLVTIPMVAMCAHAMKDSMEVEFPVLVS